MLGTGRAKTTALMKNILTRRPVLLRSLPLLLFGVGAVPWAQGQLLQQDFSSSTTVADYVSATPGNGQFNAIGTSGAGTTVSIDTGGGNKLRFVRTGNAGSFSRTTDFSPVPASLMYRFDLTVSGNSSATTSAATWQVGSGFGTANSTESNANTYARFTLNLGANDGEFQIRDISNGTNSGTFSGTRTILWVLNNSGGTLSYIDPTGAVSSIADDRADIWVGSTLAFDDVAVQTDAQTMTDLKFVFNNGAGTIDIDNILIDPVPSIPAIQPISGVGAMAFTANWNTVSGVTGYGLDVSTAADFSSFVPGYEDLYVSGQSASSHEVTGLSTSTQYYCRVRGVGQYAVGAFSSGHSGTEDATTLASVSTSVQFVSTVGSVAENAGTIGLVLSISDHDATEPTNVTISVSGATGRIIGHTSPVVFPANSSANETCTVTLDDNALCDGDEAVVFTITEITGGQGTPFAGANDVHTLTVEDDEVADEDVVAEAATAINGTGFTANWGAVSGATGYFLDVSTSPTFGTPAGLMVQWDFPDDPDDAVADDGLAVNLDREITTVGANAPSFGVAGATTRAATANGWDDGSGTKYWLVDFSTEGHGALTVSSKQRSSNTGPRDFKLQYRVGVSGTWTDVDDGEVTVADNFTSGVLDEVPLPAECNDRPQVFLRWIMTSNTSVNGGTVFGAGTSRIDDIIVSAADDPIFVMGYEDLSVGNVTSHEVTGLNGLTDYYYRVRSVGGCSSGEESNVIDLTTEVVPVYYSRASGNVNDPIWSATSTGAAGSATWTVASSMVVQEGHAVTVNVNTNVDDLMIEEGGHIAVGQERLLSVYGDQVTLAGTVASANGEIELVGFDPVSLDIPGTVELNDLTVATVSGTTVTGGLDIRGTLLLALGDFDATGATVRLRSNVSRTGRLGPVGAAADYLGDLTVQRRVPPGVTNWRLLGSPVEGATVADWNDDFFTAGFPGSDHPPFYVDGDLWPSIRWYDETVADADVDAGLTGVSGLTQELAPGQGYAVWSGDALGGTSAFTVQVSGPPVIAKTPTPFGLPMSWTDSGNPTSDGWNLVSNPLPSPIAFEDIDLGDEVENGYYVYDPVSGSTAHWDGELQESTPEGVLNGVIQSSQGFWLKAFGDDVDTFLDEQTKTVGDDGGLFGGTVQDARPLRPMLRLTIQGADAWKDQAAVLLEDGAPSYGRGDALKLDFAHPDAPRIATRSSDGHDLILNRHGRPEGETEIPVSVRVPADGAYSITVSVEGLRSLTCLTLEDLVTGISVPLTDGVVHGFEMEATSEIVTDRFLLHMSAPVPFEVMPALCQGSATGQVRMLVPEGAFGITLEDAFGNILQEVVEAPSGELVLEGLVAGNYVIAASGGTSCGQVTAGITISEPFAMEALTGTTAASCPDTPDGALQVAVFGGEAPYDHMWSNGGTEASVPAMAGTYDVMITDANGCTLEVEGLVVPGGEGPISGFEVPEGPVLAGQEVLFINTTVMADTYLWDFGDGNTSEDESPVHVFAHPGTYAVVLSAFGSGCEDSWTEDVVVEVGAGLGEAGTVPVSVWSDGAHFLIEHGYQAPFMIEVLDATGRSHVRKEAVAGPGRVLLPAASLTAGIWFVRLVHEGRQEVFRVPLVR